MPKDLEPTTLRLKRGDIRVRTRGDLTAVVWRDKRDVCLLTNIHDPPTEGNYRDKHGNAIKPAIVENSQQNPLQIKRKKHVHEKKNRVENLTNITFTKEQIKTLEMGPQ